MQLLSVLIGIFSLHCAIGARCHESEKESIAQCMKIIHSHQHAELLGNISNVPRKCLQQVTTLLKDVRSKITNEQSTTTNKQCITKLLTRVDDISKSFMARVIAVDRNVKERFLDTYAALGSAVVKSSQCMEKHHVSCDVIQSCCTNVRDELYAQKSISSETISNFLVEFSTQFGKECDWVLSTIRNIRGDLSSCKTGFTDRKKIRMEAVMMDKDLKSQASTDVMTSNLLVSCSVLFVVLRAMYER